MKKNKTRVNDPDDLFSELYKKVEDCKNNTGTWREKINTNYKLRMRQKKTKTFPFPGCSNLRLPTIETVVRKAKAALLSMFTNVRPRVMIIAERPELMMSALKIERFLDWVADTKIKLLPKLAVVTDNMLQNGVSVAKIIWRMTEVRRTETIIVRELPAEMIAAIFDPQTPRELIAQEMARRLEVDLSESVVAENKEAIDAAVNELLSGKDKIKITLRDELYNAPDVIPCDPSYIYVPPDGGIDIQSLEYIAHEYLLSYREIKAMADIGAVEKDAFEEIDYYRAVDLKDERNVNFSKDQKEGIERLNNQSQMVRLIDYFGYYDLDKDGIEEKCHFLLAPDFSVVLKKQRLENDSQLWPFVRFATEIIDDRWYSARGYPEHLEDISKEIDAQHNQKLDSQTIRNSPMFKFRTGAVNPRLVKFIPGQGIPINGVQPLDDTLKLMDNSNPNIEFSYEREEMLLKTTIQEYLGQVDFSVQSMINKRQPRTLGEVQMQSQAANTVFSLDAALYTKSLCEVYEHLLDFCAQYMPERVSTMIMGPEGAQALNITRDEIQGRWTLFCRGNDINSNPALRAQKALSRVQTLLSEPVLSLGVVTPVNVFNILKHYLQSDNELAWQEMISPPQPPRQQPGQDVKIAMDQLTDSEQAQILAARGIRPDVKGRSLKSAAIIEEKMAARRDQEFDNVVKLMDGMNVGRETAGESESGE